MYVCMYVCMYVTLNTLYNLNHEIDTNIKLMFTLDFVLLSLQKLNNNDLQRCGRCKQYVNSYK